MNDSYSEVREYLRQEHAKNTNEICGRNIDEWGLPEHTEEVSPTFLFKGKILLFLLSVMLVSCYLYGGMDVKKGAVMAWNDMQHQITLLEEKEPIVKEAVSKTEQAYHAIKSCIKAYVDEMEDTNQQESFDQKQ